MFDLPLTAAWRVCIALAAVVAVVAVAPRSAFSQSAARKMLSTKVRFGGPLDVSAAGVLVGKRLGAFEREGIAVEVSADLNDEQAVEYVAANPDAIGVVSVYSFLLARARSVPIVGFASAYQSSPIVFYTTVRSKIRLPDDFVGHTVAYQPGTSAAIVYSALLTQNRIPRSRVREIEATPTPSLLANGTVDVLPGSINQAPLLKRLGLTAYSIDPAKYGVHAPGSVYFARSDVLRDNPELIKRFLIGLSAGWESAYDDYSASIPILKEAITEPTDSDTIRELMDNQREFLRPLGSRLGEISRLQWNTAQADLIHQRRLSAPIDLAGAINEDILSTINRQKAALSP
ncbi:NitT/TauT family transport system substrate-binding protein [Bradyrhizobium sp. USDA 4449]